MCVTYMYSHIYLYMQLVYNVDLCEYLTKYFIKLHKTLSWVLSCLFTCICKWKCIFWHLVDIVFVYILEFTIPNFMKLFWVPPKLHWFQELLICRTYLKRFLSERRNIIKSRLHEALTAINRFVAHYYGHVKTSVKLLRTYW